MFNKKYVISFLAFSLLIVSAFAANAKELSMATGGTSGTFFPLGGAIANTINKHCPDANITVQTSDGSVNNAHLLGNGDVDLALIQTDITYYAYNGLEMYKKKYPNLAAVCRVYPDTTHIIARSDSGITKITDMKGKQISVGAPGSGNEATLRQIFETAGITYKDIKPFYLSFSESSEHFKDGHISAFHVNSSVPASIVHDLNSLNKVVLVPVEGKHREKLMKKYPFYTAVSIPANTYKYQTKPYETVAVQSLFVVDKNLPEDLVYKMTKALFENLNEVKSAHSAAKGMSLKTALDGVSIPLHPGAEKYFKEKGIKK